MLRVAEDLHSIGPVFILRETLFIVFLLVKCQYLWGAFRSPVSGQSVRHGQ
jgi:hypothetical protein